MNIDFEENKQDQLKLSTDNDKKSLADQVDKLSDLEDKIKQTEESLKQLKLQEMLVTFFTA